MNEINYRTEVKKVYPTAKCLHFEVLGYKISAATVGRISSYERTELRAWKDAYERIIEDIKNK